MTQDTSTLYIYVPNWEEHQPRADRPNLPWLRLHTSLLGNDAWLALSAEDRCLLITIWMLVQRYGNGRVMASLRWLQSQANLPLSNRYRGLERLNQAGFIELSSTKAEPYGGLEERRGSKEPKEEKENARASSADPPGLLAHAENGRPPTMAEVYATLERQGHGDLIPDSLRR